MPQPRRSAAYKPPRAAPVCNVPVAMDFSPTQDEPPHEQTVEQPAEAEEQMEEEEEEEGILEVLEDWRLHA